MIEFIKSLNVGKWAEGKIIEDFNTTGGFKFNLDYEIAQKIYAFAKKNGYAAELVKDEVRVQEVEEKENNGKKVYLRAGFLPENGKSFNYLTKESENGVSVFDLENGLPILNTLQLVDDFSGRYGKPYFFVTGEEIGKGFDGEPVLNNVEIISLADLDVTSITLNVLDNCFETKTGELKENENEIHRFFLNGLEVSYKGFTYSNPKKDFNTEMGKRGKYGILS